MADEQGRIISIIHRVKKTAKGESRPTIIAIADKGGKILNTYELKTESDELDFILGRFPISHRKVEDGEDLSKFLKHHLKTKKDPNSKGDVVAKVPDEYEGLKKGDLVIMVLGGSGDRMAFAIANHGKENSITIKRVKPIILAERRDEKEKNKDNKLLIDIYLEKPELFWEITERDRQMIRVRELYQQRTDAMKARIACEQRLRQRFVGQIFLSEEGGYPEGNLEDVFDERKASDEILGALIREEKEREKELKKAVQQLDVWQKIFKDVEGVGEVIAAGIISCVIDVRRFPTVSKFSAFCGVHVDDGKLPRMKAGGINYNPGARQSFYLLGDQFVRRKESRWGKKLLEFKSNLRKAHPVKMCRDCNIPWDECKEQNKHKSIYSDGHIHKTAIWRTVTRFNEWLYREWNKLYEE